MLYLHTMNNLFNAENNESKIKKLNATDISYQRQTVFNTSTTLTKPYYYIFLVYKYHLQNLQHLKVVLKLISTSKTNEASQIGVVLHCGIDLLTRSKTFISLCYAVFRFKFNAFFSRFIYWKVLKNSRILCHFINTSLFGVR